MKVRPGLSTHARDENFLSRFTVPADCRASTSNVKQILLDTTQLENK